MSLKHNLIANYISQFTLVVISAIMMPQYIKHLGSENYGLVGFYLMAQGWLQLLDMGMTPTLIRETAQYRGGEITLEKIRTLLRTLESTFTCIALIIICLAFLFSFTIANSWLNVEQTPVNTVQTSLQLIACAVILRWISSLYRGVIIGFEEIKWLSFYNICIGGARFIGVMPIILWVDNGPVIFFAYQLLISCVEIIILKIKAGTFFHLCAPKPAKNSIPLFHWPSLQRVMGFSATIAVTSSAWAIATQSDKLLLSKILSLTDYGYFTLVVMAASGIALLGGTLGTALMPRLSKLSAENKIHEITLLYRTATQAVAAISLPATLALAFFPEPILFAWTGNSEFAKKTSNVLLLYSLGNGLLVFNAFPYYLQYAYGKLRLHLIGSILFLLLYIPLLVFLSLRYGLIGAGWSWFLINSFSFVFWVAFLHKKLCPKLHIQWLLRDIGVYLICCTPLVVVFSYFITWTNSQLQTFFILLGICSILLLSTLIPFFLFNHIRILPNIRTVYEKYCAR